MAISRRRWLLVGGLVLVIVVGAVGWFGWQRPHSRSIAEPAAQPSAAQPPAAPATLSATGRSAFFVLEPGYQLTYAAEDGEQLVITVLDQTEQVDGVTTRVLEERETKDGALKEISRNFLAMDPATGDLYYFGEDVDDYSNGQIVGHGGAWRSGVGGAKFGLLLPGAPRVGQKHAQEVAPGVAMDQAEVSSITESVRVPAGAFTGVLAVSESSPLEPTATSRKYYAPGIGLIKDDELALVKYGKAG